MHKKTLKALLRDYFDNLIEIGDRYFYASPTTTGVVCAIKKKSIEIKLDNMSHGINIMKCRSPDRGVCLDKISTTAKTKYKVTWQIWKGIEPCGRAIYASFSQSFTDLKSAQSSFKVKSINCYRATLTKTTTEVLDKADD